MGFCKGCLACLKSHRCVMHDDADSIAQKMKEADENHAGSCQSFVSFGLSVP